MVYQMFTAAQNELIIRESAEERTADETVKRMNGPKRRRR